MLIHGVILAATFTHVVAIVEATVAESVAGQTGCRDIVAATTAAIVDLRSLRYGCQLIRDAVCRIVVTSGNSNGCEERSAGSQLARTVFTARSHGRRHQRHRDAPSHQHH